MTVVRLDDRRSPHPDRVRRLEAARRPLTDDNLPAIQEQLRGSSEAGREAGANASLHRGTAGGGGRQQRLGRS